MGSLSARELREWRVFAAHEPIGGGRLDVVAAMITAQIANVNRRKGRPAYSPAKMIPEWWKPPKPEQTPEDMIRFAASVTRGLRGTVSQSAREVADGANGRGTRKPIR